MILKKIRSFFLGLIFLFFCQISLAVDVVFRFDDFRIVDDSLQLQYNLVRTFEKNEIPLSIGIIPFDSEGHLICDNRSEVAYLSQLRNKGLIEICLHGYSHTRNTAGGEFGGLSQEEQMFRLEEGKKALEQLFDAPVITFIPPWNNYDDLTLSIIDSLGFKAISSCMTFGQDFSNPNISYFPCTVGTSDAFGSFQQSLSANHKRNGIIVFMFHHYDFKEFSMSELDGLLKQIKGMPDVNCFRFCDLVDLGIISDEKRMKANLETNLLSKILGVNTICLNTKDARLIRLTNFGIYLLLLVVIMVLLSKIFHSQHLISLFVTLLSAIILFLCVWLHWWTPLKSLLLCTVMPGVLIVFQLLLRRITSHTPPPVPPAREQDNGM